MFMQIGIRGEHHDVPGFLWSESDEQKTSEHKLLIFIENWFTACSFSVSQKPATEHRQQHPENFGSITKQFSMDDFFQIFATEKKSYKTKENEITETWESNFTKLLSNNSAAKVLTKQRILCQKWNPQYNQLVSSNWNHLGLCKLTKMHIAKSH